jgi:hypothetical protein
MNTAVAITTKTQEAADRFYMQHGPCCAGCDWWSHSGSLIGECRKSAPVSASERHSMVRMDRISWQLAGEPDAGHILTNREHHCGDFKDGFDWPSLPAHYLRRIGWQAPTTTDGAKR